MNELALYAGVGGGLLASKALGWTTICAVEKEPFCREVLLRRQADGLFPLFPIWDDVRTFDGRPWRGIVDIITAGFPCQPFSVAGRKRGEHDDRNLWPETLRIIRECQPPLCFFENVPGLLANPYFETILGDLESLLYTVPPPVIAAASEVGAGHERERLFFASYSRRELREEGGAESAANKLISDLHNKRLVASKLSRPAVADFLGSGYGVAHRVDRLRAIGNGIVPQQMCRAWELLTR